MQHRIASTTFHRLAAGALLTGLLLGATACGDDDDEAAAESPTTDADGNVDNGFGPAACDAWVELNGAFAQAPQDPAEMAAFGETLVGIVEGLAAELPEALAADGTFLVDAAGAVAADGNPEAFFSPEGQQAQTNIGAFAHDDCEGEAIDVTATEFAFDGVGDELPAGRVSIKFVNEGTEEHEMIVLRRNDGSDATFEELAGQGPDAIFGEAAFTGVVFGGPGQTGYTALDLEAGTYFLVCTIPTGGDPEAEPHLAHGMHHTVEVV